MKKIIKMFFYSTAIVGGMLFLASCSKSDVTPAANQSSAASASLRSGTNGIASAIPAYYDAKLFKIIFVEFSPQAEASQIAHNTSINFIYQYDPGLPGGLPFISVIDAIPGDGMNPVWREVQLVFTPGHTPHQFLSDNDVLAAVTSGEITLDMTNEVYYCPVIGKP